MRRPYIGAAVMALVLVAAVVVRSTRDTAVAGSGTAAPVATAPAVGNCLVEQVSRIGVLTSQANQPVFRRSAAMTGGVGVPRSEECAAAIRRSGPRQLAAGQQWVACIAVPQVTDALGGTSKRYLGSIRNGFSTSPPPPATSDGDSRACLRFAAGVTAMADPTASGRLTVGVQISPVSDQDPDVGLDAWCMISPADPSEHLIGPLLGLRDGPLPLR